MRRSRHPAVPSCPHMVINYDSTLFVGEDKVFSTTPSKISIQIDSPLNGERYVPLEVLVDAYLLIEKDDELSSTVPV